MEVTIIRISSQKYTHHYTDDSTIRSDLLRYLSSQFLHSGNKKIYTIKYEISITDNSKKVHIYKNLTMEQLALVII